MLVSTETIALVKSTASVVEVVSKFITLKREGQNMTCKCPFHNEKSGSFTVSPSKNLYKCFGCGKAGDAIKFLQEYKKISFIDAVKELAEMYNIPLEMDTPKEIKKVYTKPTPRTDNLSDAAVSYFATRGIFLKTLQEMKVTGATQWMPKTENNTDTICFNYYRDGELINIKSRAVKEKNFLLSSNAELLFYNIDSIKNVDSVVIVEGEIDALTVHQCGVKKVVSVPNGASNSEKENLPYLESAFEYFANVKKVVIFTDNDKPGQALMETLARRIGKEKCFMASHLPDCKDANDILLKYGQAFVYEAIKQAVPYPIEGVFSMADLNYDIEKFYREGYPEGVKVGIPEFDDRLSFMEGQFTTITGIPRSGKSEFTDLIISKLALNHSWRFGIISFENQPAAIHATKIMEKVVGKSFAFRKNPEHRISIDEKDIAKKFMDNHFFFVNVKSVDVTVDGLLQKAKELVFRKGIKGLLIDPWNYLEHKFGKGQDETQYVSEVLTKIKSFCAQYQIHIFLVAHPTKMPKVNGKFEVPNLYSISGSAHFFNKTDNGICVHRDFASPEVDIHIQKVRYSWLGSEGMITMNYNLDTRQYESQFASTTTKGDMPKDGAYQNTSKPYKEDEPF